MIYFISIRCLLADNPRDYQKSIFMCGNLNRKEDSEF